MTLPTSLPFRFFQITVDSLSMARCWEINFWDFAVWWVNNALIERDFEFATSRRFAMTTQSPMKDLLNSLGHWKEARLWNIVNPNQASLSERCYVGFRNDPLSFIWPKIP
jgi:hypothetical protein